MVEHVLAKDETGVRFSLAAQSKAKRANCFALAGEAKDFSLRAKRDGKIPGYVVADSP